MPPSDAVNRFPSIGSGADMLSYTVYMNGAAGRNLPEHLQQHDFKDVTLAALSEKLGLDPKSHRDNLKVAEVVSIRSSYMSAKV